MHRYVCIAVSVYTSLTAQQLKAPGESYKLSVAVATCCMQLCSDIDRDLDVSPLSLEVKEAQACFNYNCLNVLYVAPF